MKRDERQERIGPKKEKLRRQQEEQKGEKSGSALFITPSNKCWGVP